MNMMIGLNGEMNILTIIIAPMVALMIFLISLREFGKKNGGKDGKLQLPPGDRLALVGSASFIKSQSPYILTDFLKNQFAKHGRVFTARLLGRKIIFSGDADLNRFVLQNEKKLFANDIPAHISPLLGQSDLFIDADDIRYKNMKSMVLGFLHSWDLRTAFLEDVQKAADWVLSSWREKDVVFVSEEAKRFAFNLIGEKTMGFKADDPEGEKLRREFFVLDEGIFAVPINFPFTRYAKALNARKNMLKIMKKTVERKKMEAKENKKPTDMIEWLLETYPNASAEKISDSLIPIIYAALVNISKTIALAIYFLNNCPKAVQKMREEYMQVLRSKEDAKTNPVWDDYKHLKFSQCVINETLRLGSIVPGLSKKAKEDIDYKGYLLPKGVSIITYNAATQLDPTAFESLETFDPWRWETTEKSKHFMPFGGGVRYCNGVEIARLEIAIFLNRFVHNYNWEPAQADHPIAQPVVFPKNFPVKVYPLDTAV